MSTLLEQASLIMIPSGYKEDVVYSVIPETGAGDLSFTRASNGTRINSAGLVEVVPWNFVEQSSNLGSWSNAGVTITTGITDAFGTTNAITMGAISSGNYTDYIVKSNNSMPLPTGTQINFSVYLKGSGTIAVTIERSVSGNYFLQSEIVTLSNAWVRYDFAYTIGVGINADGISFYVSNATGTTATSVDICFPQINYGSTAKPYFPTTDRLNVPRLTHQNGGGGCPSLLLEKQSTNNALYSEDYSNAIWTKADVTISSNVVNSPDGTQNADLIYPNSSGNYKYIYQAFSLSSNIYTLSVFAKAQNKNVIWVYIEDSSNYGLIYFDLSDGTMSTTAGSVSTPTGTMSAMGNGWYRCTFTLGSSIALSAGSGFGVCDAKGSPYATASGTNGIYVWGAQLE